MSSKRIVLLHRSKSLCSLSSDYVPSLCDKEDSLKSYRSRSMSEASIEVFVAQCSDSEESKSVGIKHSELGDQILDADKLAVLECKIDRLNEMFLEQCNLLMTLKEEVQNSTAAMEKVDLAQVGALNELVKKIIEQSSIKEEPKPCGDDDEANPRAKCLLDAIELPVNKDIRDIIASLLQSDEIKEAMVKATSESVRDVVAACVSRDVSAVYLPVLQHAQRRLVRALTRTVQEAFLDLEESSASLAKTVYNTSKHLRRAIEKHQYLLEATTPWENQLQTIRRVVEEVLHNELQEWRAEVMQMMTSQLESASEDELYDEPESPDPREHGGYSLRSPLHEENQGRSIMDKLFIAAKITRQIEDGEINQAFERALSSGDLSLVMTACRAAVRSNQSVFAPRCRLQQPVLLALLQQVSTDMLRDTKLKCRYLEDAMVHLDLSDPNTRSHLPLVVDEIRRHISNFLVSYPTHSDTRRLSLIINTADNLLK